MFLEKGKHWDARQSYPGATDHFELSARLFVQCRVDQPEETFLRVFVHDDGKFRVRFGEERIEGKFATPFRDDLWEREFSLGRVIVAEPNYGLEGVLRHDTSGFLRSDQLRHVSTELALVIGLTKFGNQQTPLVVVTSDLLVGFHYNYEYAPGDQVIPVWVELAN